MQKKKNVGMRKMPLENMSMKCATNLTVVNMKNTPITK